MWVCVLDGREIVALQELRAFSTTQLKIFMKMITLKVMQSIWFFYAPRHEEYRGMEVQ
jgi:hypothetical protein